MKNTSIKICDATIQPGEVANLALPLPERYSCSPLYMPIKVIHGKKKGPCVVVFSVLKGAELNGLEIANRISNLITPEKVSGTLITIPVVNIYGLTHYPTTLPGGKNLANCFPGDENGNFGERIAHIFTEEILKKADYCIELQTGEINHNILPQIYCNFEDNKAKALAKVFNAPVVMNVNIEGSKLRQTTEELQIPLLVYQAGEAMRFDENSITFGVDGIKNVLRFIDMLEKEHAKEINPIFSRDEEWIIAPKAGILHPKVSLGQHITKDEIIGSITDPFGAELSENIKADKDGIVIGVNMTPLIHEGLQLFKIASFLDDDKAKSVIEEWDQKQPDSYIS